VTTLQHLASNRAPFMYTHWFFSHPTTYQAINSCSHRSSSCWRAV